MDTIVTPVTVITLDSTRIVHSIKADLVARYFPPVVRLVQYDQSLPVIAVSLMQNGQTYTLPSGAAANIRVHKPDATYVYNPALGCDSTRNIVYFEVTQAMAAANGDGLAIVEIVVDGDIAGTSLTTLHFEENPVPEDAIESSDEWETIYELGERIIASTVTPVSTAAGMTDHNVVYLYTGTESGWNQGHMYYYNGTTWVDAGIAVTDKTLTVEGLAADAKKTGEEIADLKDGLSDLYSVQNTGILPTAGGVYSYYTKEFFANSGFEYAVIEADSTDKIYLTTKGFTNTAIAMYYSGTPLNSTTWIGYQGDLTEKQYTDELLVIPSGTKYIAINNRLGGNFNIKKSLPLSNEVKNIIARYDGTTVTLQTKYTTDSDLILSLGKGGGNNLVDFRLFAEKKTDGTYGFYFTNTTDWFMPYKVRAVSNVDGDLPDNWYSHFTGGNHQYNNTGSGSTATARCVIDAVLFDGVSVSSGAEAHCKKVELYWTNYIQGQNTKKSDGTGREILMEKYHLSYDGDLFDVEHYFMPLEEVSMLTYYGLGIWWNVSQGNGYKCQYVGGETRTPITMNADSNSGVKTCREIYFIDGKNNKIDEILLDTDLGLQDHNSQAYSAFTSGSKVYFNLWNTTSTLSANEKYFHKAKIRFTKQY